MLKALCVTFAMLFVFILGRAVERMHVMEAARDRRVYKAGEKSYIVLDPGCDWTTAIIHKGDPKGGADHETDHQ